MKVRSVDVLLIAHQFERTSTHRGDGWAPGSEKRRSHHDSDRGTPNHRAGDRHTEGERRQGARYTPRDREPECDSNESHSTRQGDDSHPRVLIEETGRDAPQDDVP